MKKKGRQLQLPRDVPVKAQLLGPRVSGYSVGQWCSSSDGSGKPEAVGVAFNVLQLGDIVLRLKSRRAVNEMIRALVEHRDEVFPVIDDPAIRSPEGGIE